MSENGKNYGIDAPNVIRNLATIGTLCIAISIGIFSLVDELNLLWKIAIGWVFLVGVSLISTAVIMILSSRFGKMKERERILDILGIRGNERILDVGCGRGLYLIGLARRLTTGKATGIDIWQSADLSGNQIDNTLQNAEIAGVSDKIDVETCDMRDMCFADNSFDVVISSLAIHNIYDSSDRKKALLEIVRVLKPKGRLCIVDFQHIDEYMDVLKGHGVLDMKRIRTRNVFPIATMIMGVKA